MEKSKLLKMWIFNVSILVFLQHSVALDIIETPSDAAAMKGNDLILTCTTSDAGEPDYLEWAEFISNSEGQRIWLSDSDPSDVSDPNKYAIEGKYSLRIKQLGLDDGGKYGCKLIVKHDAHFTAHVTVFEPAECTAMGEDLHEYDMGYISCNVPYGGVNPPNVHFYDTVTGDELQIDYDRGEHYVYISANITADYEEDKKLYECQVSLSSPNYHDNCRAALNVSYTVRNISIAPESLVFYTGEQINCTCLGNPDPSIRWEKIIGCGGNETIHGPTLDVSPTMLGVNTWKCVAENEVEDNVTTIMKEISFTAVPATTPGDIVGSAARISLSVLLPALLMIIIGSKTF